MFGVKEGTLILSDCRMDYLVFGSGTKPLVMIQGLNTRRIRGAGYGLAMMYRNFSKEFRVYLFDRREEIREGITVRDMAADTAAAMDAIGISGACVFGVSQGGMIAQYLAIDRPDLVDALVLAVTLSRNNGTVEAVINHWIDLTQRGAWKQLVADMAERMYSSAYLKRYRPFLPLLTVLQKPKEIPEFLALAKACLTCSAYDELEQIQCPVLVLSGGQDHVVTAAAGAELAEKLGCEHIVYEDLGHAAYEEAKDFNQRVYSFFRCHEDCQRRAAIERVRRMEFCLDTVREAVDSETPVCEATLKELLQYYEGGQWLRDYHLEEQGFFPSDLKRGVLAEDTVYNLLAQINPGEEARL